MENRLSICVAAVSDAGGREANEDSYLALSGDRAPCDTLGLIAVADGMGGTGNGHVASSLTMSTLADAFAAACEVSHGNRMAETCDLLKFAVQKANAAVYRAAQETQSNRGMGTTCAAVAITEDKAHIAHVGDSRVYLFRDGALKRLVEDHWLKPSRSGKTAAEKGAATKGKVTFVTKAIGWQPIITPDMTTEPVREGDIILICSDGLTDELPEEEIEQVLRDSPDIYAACDRLVRSACANEGCDNVTLVMAKLLSAEQ